MVLRIYSIWLLVLGLMVRIRMRAMLSMYNSQHHHQHCSSALLLLSECWAYACVVRLGFEIVVVLGTLSGIETTQILWYIL